jgi:DNA repair protein RadC
MQSQSAVQRIQSSTLGSASPIDLLAVGFSRRENDVADSEEMAKALLQRIRRIEALAELSTADIQEITGLEGFETLQRQALIELGRRAGAAGKGDSVEICGVPDVLEYLKDLRKEKREHFCTLMLDSKNVVQRKHVTHIGTLTMSVVGAREVFREAIREGASGIIVAHNHPSGDPTPSPEDIGVTDKLVEIGKMLDIPVLDHVIIGERRYFSFKERGLID